MEPKDNNYYCRMMSEVDPSFQSHVITVLELIFESLEKHCKNPALHHVPVKISEKDIQKITGRKQVWPIFSETWTILQRLGFDLQQGSVLGWWRSYNTMEITVNRSKPIINQIRAALQRATIDT